MKSTEWKFHMPRCFKKCPDCGGNVHFRREDQHEYGHVGGCPRLFSREWIDADPAEI